ncbi:ArsR family transcriptional regulator [Catellatospora coxensis]|uniref:Uncharacterized protein n=1 Tax=Catellatospora coxensis TaxID=310354 RepID=A0A8J3KWE3_9ACTN|nr:ArsR family transcriptional regulator [Catellatospora coxensis]GIG10227.1 hypothetical protein Cco03nite_69270 [Catellatospora coxensis]
MQFDPAVAQAWLQDNATLLTTIAGAATALILGALILRTYRRGGVDATAMLIAAPLVIGWEAEGVYEVLRDSAAPVSFALIGCLMTSMVMVSLGAKGHKHFKQHGTIGPNGRTVWYIAIPVGIIVAASADTASMQGLRILIPVLGATLWWSEYRPDEPAGQRAKVAGSWVWTPRRIAARLGLIAPGEGDIVTLHHERGVRQLVRAQYALRYGWLGPRSWREARVRRVARNVTEEMATEAYEQMARIERVVEMTAPGYVPAKMTPPSAPEEPADEVEEEPLSERPVSGPPATSRHPLTTQAVAKVAARNPSWKPAQIAAKVGMSESTVRRHLNAIRAAETPATVAAPAEHDAAVSTADGQTLLEVLADITAGRREPLTFAQIGELFGEDETWAMEHIRPHVMQGGSFQVLTSA